MTQNQVPQSDRARAFFEEAKARLLRTAPVLDGVPDPPNAPAAHADAEYAAPRELLAKLGSLDGQIEATLRAVTDLKEAEAAAASAAKSPARSPEEAWRTACDARSFRAANEGPIREAEKTIADLTKMRRRVLEGMALSGFFEGRWINDDGRALYLERTEAVAPAYELHEAPWRWIKDAPPGEDPRETMRRGPILERHYHRNNQALVLFGTPFAAYCLASALPPVLAHYSVAVAAALFAALLFALPLARESLFGRMWPTPLAQRRLVEEQAASAQLALITRTGEQQPPSLETITEAMLAGLRKHRGHKERIACITVVEAPEEHPHTAGQPNASSPDEEGAAR